MAFAQHQTKRNTCRTAPTSVARFTQHSKLHNRQSQHSWQRTRQQQQRRQVVVVRSQTTLGRVAQVSM
jgi:hypothetical protein